MRLIEINNPREARAFIRVPLRLYRGDPNWIRPLDKDIHHVFDPAHNKLLRKGSCVRFIVEDGGEPIGRIAAFVNPATSQRQNQPTGGIGFFECMDSQQAANMLFDAGKEWLTTHGMEAMDGPINFGERDRWWGCLIDGFTEPNYCCNYNPPYHAALFENYGFREYFRQFTFRWPMDTQLPEKYREKAERIARNPGYSFRHVNKGDLDGYAEHFQVVYSKAWGKHHGVSEIAPAQARALFRRMKPVLDEEIIWFGYYDEEPIAFFLMLPEVNQIFKHVNGKMNLLGKLKFIYHRWRGTCRKMFGVAFGIVPEHQGKGVEGALVMAAASYIQPLNRYDVFEMNWIGDFNPTMIKISENVGAHVAKTHVTYRYLFDRDKPFERHPMLE